MPQLLTTAAAATTTLAAAAAAIAYAGLSNESQWFGRSLTAPPSPHQIALTFDDGPNPAVTPHLLDLLGAHNVKATFFLIGTHALKAPQLTRQIATAGHTVGNHTMSHPWLPRHSAAFISQQIRDCNRALEDTLGQPVTLFRPPFGARRPAVFRAAQQLGLTTVQWNLIVGDWKPITGEEIYRRIARGLALHRRQRRGTCVVLHDGGQHTLTAERMPTVDAVRLLLTSAEPEPNYVQPPDWR